jgi:hypothetical protein
MQFVSLVPLWLGITFVIVMALLKAAFIAIVVIVGLIAWIIYEIFFKEEKKESEEEEVEPGVDFWDKMMEEQNRNDADFYRRIGRMEQQLDDLEEVAGISKKKRRKKK